ncbi:hypothetical protein JNL27_09170 [bacterium]|nr:hypothetical protein [bacterium]
MPKNISQVSPEENLRTNLCKECGKQAKAIQRVTIYHMLKRPFMHEIQDTTYFYCETMNCDVVYFSNETGQYFFQDQIRVPVGSKQGGHEKQLCYCFDYTMKNIEDEIENKGNSSAADDITAKVQAKLCACEIKNPAGRCCLGQVRAAVKEALVKHSEVKA